MNRTVTIIIVILFSLNATAQRQFNQWFFGRNAGLDFNSGSPVSVAGGMTGTDEGVASIADANGNLLFYSDGVTVWNSIHGVMPNGTGLLGGFSSTQSATIVPVPGNINQYYIFTTDQQGGANGVEYSIVDMTLQGGLGDIGAVKNVQLLPATTEGATVVQHANGTDFWLIAHPYNSGDFYAYQITSAGILPPVVTTIGTVITIVSSNECIGYLKASPCGNKIAYANWGVNYFEVYDFSSSTGVLSNWIYLPSVAASSGAYGVEFSPDGSILYGSIITPSLIYQWDLNAGSAAAIAASMTLVGTASASFNGELQLGPDSKIYLVQYNVAYLGAITSPNTLGLGCNYVDQAVILSSGIGTLGLPEFYGNIWCSLLPTALFNTNNHICPGTCISFNDLSSNATSWQWNFPGGSPSSSTDQNPTGICYEATGFYPVTQIVTNASGTDTLTLNNYIVVYPSAAVPSITQSGDTLIAPATYAGYQWYFGSNAIAGATNYNYVATQSGNYNIVVTDSNGCQVGAGILNVIAGLPSYSSSTEDGISFSPNPFSTTATLTIDKKLLQEETQFKIFDLIGKEVSSVDITDVKTEIRRDGLRSGMYFYKVMSGEKEIFCGRIIIND